VLRRIGTLVLKEFIQFGRDWVMTAFILTLPVLQLTLLAQATGSGIYDLCVAVLDRDHSSASRRLVTALDAHRRLRVCHYPETVAETHHMLDQGEATLAVIIPFGFASDLASIARVPGVQLIADGSNNIPASHALSAARETIGAVGASRVAPPMGGWPEGYEQGATSPVELRTTVRFNPELNVKFFTVPAQVGFIVYQVTLVVAAIGLARERELGTLEQLIVIPLRRLELVIGKAIPALVVGTVNFLLMLGVAVFAFHLPMRGSVPLLLILTVLFILTEIGYGVLISGLARTQQQAILFVFVLAMVDMAFSGYMVRVKNLPGALQAIAQVVPFRHYLAIIRGVMLKGVGLDVLWPHAAAMAILGVVVTSVAARNLNRSLD
jgi:ABC-2 type transport system permease protein